MDSAYDVIHLTEDAAGESHFGAFALPLHETEFAPPARPFQVSPIMPAKAYVAIRIPAGWVGELHRSPHRQILFCMSGALKVTASDGEVRLIQAGSVWQMEDVSGQGHWSEVPTEVPFDAVIIVLDTGT
jgi:quercetin dioxygenase-like cupin family protein